MTRLKFKPLQLFICPFLSLVLFFSTHIYSQADLPIGGYFQDFGTTSISWTSGATSGPMKGWYYSTGNNRGNVNITGTTTPVPNNYNAGGVYNYTCNGNAMIGSRAASSPNSNIYYGVRLKNTSGTDLTLLEVSFDWFQISLAQNQSNLNTISFHYQTGVTVTSLTTGSWTAVTSLDFSNVSNDNTGSSTQLQWYPPCNAAFSDYRGTNRECIVVSIPAGNEIMLRWSEINESANDHHMGIDNVSVVGFPEDDVSSTCALPLAVDLVEFKGKYVSNVTELYWETSTERNNNYFTLFRSKDGVNWENIGNVAGAGNSNVPIQYAYTDADPYAGFNYYRLQSVDYDGRSYERGIVAVSTSHLNMYYNALTSTIELDQIASIMIYSLDGKLIDSSEGTKSVPFYHTGVFIVYNKDSGVADRLFVGKEY